MTDKNKVQEYYTRPKELGKWEGFKVFLWNSETSECLGRTGGSWGKLAYQKSFNFFFREVLSKLLRKKEKTWTILFYFGKKSIENFPSTFGWG
jgi:hypothetical protein